MHDRSLVQELLLSLRSCILPCNTPSLRRVYCYFPFLTLISKLPFQSSIDTFMLYTISVQVNCIIPAPTTMTLTVPCVFHLSPLLPQSFKSTAAEQTLRASRIFCG